MSKIKKVQKMVLIAIGFGLATYFIMSGMAMLELDEQQNSAKKIK